MEFYCSIECTKDVVPSVLLVSILYPVSAYLMHPFVVSSRRVSATVITLVIISYFPLN